MGPLLAQPAVGKELAGGGEAPAPDPDAALDDPVGDGLLRLMFIACPDKVPSGCCGESGRKTNALVLPAPGSSPPGSIVWLSMR
jgi:hypothetical protein